jgi:hypothetical protein
VNLARSPHACHEVLILNVAKRVDFARRGADGILNAACFNSMLGTVSAAITGRLREDHGGIPIANRVNSGVEGSQRAMLEAFLHQVKAYARRRVPAGEPVPVPDGWRRLGQLWPSMQLLLDLPRRRRQHRMH